MLDRLTVSIAPPATPLPPRQPPPGSTGELGDKAEAFKKEAVERLRSWETQMFAENRHLHIIPAHRRNEKQHEIICALEGEWAARGRPFASPQAQQAAFGGAGRALSRGSDAETSEHSRKRKVPPA